MRVLDVFSGIGGFALGLDRAGGYETVGFCELDPWCREVLARHWPGVWIHDDIRTLTAPLVAERCGPIDMLCGGFPCQPVSVAGKGLAQADERWLWPEMFRLVRELRPAWVLAENVPGLRTRGADLVLADLEAEGYTCWPLVVGAEHVGAPHRRHRVWIVAHGDSDTLRQQRERAGGDRAAASEPGGGGTAVANAERDGRGAGGGVAGDEGESRIGGCEPAGGVQLEHAKYSGCEGREPERKWPGSACVPGEAHRWPARPGEPQHDWEEPRLTQPGVGQSALGLPRRLDGFARRNRLKALGNSVVPQVVEAIGRAITRAGQ